MVVFNTIALVESIATDTRWWAERYAKRAVQGGNWDICDDDLMGMCAIASAHLFTALTDAGITCRLWSNMQHCFVTVGDYVVDVTATQFGTYRRVEIIPIAETTMMAWWLRDIEHLSAAELRSYQIDAGWMKGQRVPKSLVADRTNFLNRRRKSA